MISSVSSRIPRDKLAAPGLAVWETPKYFLSRGILIFGLGKWGGDFLWVGGCSDPLSFLCKKKKHTIPTYNHMWMYRDLREMKGLYCSFIATRIPQDNPRTFRSVNCQGIRGINRFGRHVYVSTNHADFESDRVCTCIRIRVYVPATFWAVRSLYTILLRIRRNFENINSRRTTLAVLVRGYGASHVSKPICDL